MPNKFLALLLLLPLFIFSQERQTLHGRVVSNDAGIGGVFVINKATGSEAKTDALGNFTLQAKAGDGIAVYSPNIEVREFIVRDAILKERPFIVKVSQKVNQLDEVVITVPKVTSESLGLVPEGQKQYTPQERKLYTAQTGLIDPLINILSGRTRMLKKAVETEKKQMMFEEINYLYSRDEIISQFAIPDEYVTAFVYYLSEDKEFASALKNDNRALAKFLTSNLAKKYLELIKDAE